MGAKTLTLKDTAIGKKAIMAVTGVIMVGFVVGHMAGNLNAYAGREAFNGYAEFLHSMPKGLWIARIVLILSVILHVWSAIGLVKLNSAARPVKYRVKQNIVTSYAARVMPVGGVIIALFIVYHLLHLTTGTLHSDFKGLDDPFYNLVTGFQNPAIAGFYILANAALGLHLFHGVWSMFQSLGLSHPLHNAKRKALAAGVAILVAGFNISFPIAVLAGIIHL